MKFWKKYRKSIFILLCAVGIISAATAIPGTLAEPDTQAADGSLPYRMEVTYDGTKLDNDGTNAFTSDWSAGKSKAAQIVLHRNTAVSVDTSKKYVVCMKVPTALYFNGLPDAKDINGVEEVSIVKNTAPQVNTSDGKGSALTSFSPYSGEIRMVLNPSVETVTIPDIGISYDVRLVGYTGGTQTVTDPFQVSLVSVDKSLSLDNIKDSDKSDLVSSKVDSAQITTGSLRGTGMRNSISTNKFASSGVYTNITMGQSDTVSYACSSAGQLMQVYKTLSITFYCPYITVNGKDYYLDFSPNDTSFTDNKQGGSQSFKMAKNAVYNSANHTITYTFENVYLGSYSPIFYTPAFSWPSDLKNMTLSGSDKYKVYGGGWDVTEQTSYTGATGTLKSTFSPGNFASFIPETIDVKMVSSHEAADSQGIAKRQIYQGITRANGVSGTLGFFDIHNDGAKDSPKVKVSFAFNTNKNDQATYYITRVNLPVYGNTTGVDVTYTLTNGTTEKTGTKHYSNQTSFACQVADLRSDCSADGEYYIKELSYETVLQRSTAYHAETAHLNRNRAPDSGLFFGYLEGELNSYASATMTIEAADGTTVINSGSGSRVFSTERSTVSDKDYIGFGLNTMNIDDKSSVSLTAGNSTMIKFGATVSTEEYSHASNKSAVNGYHTFRDGLLYVCLPEGVSIAGTQQASVYCNGRTIAATDVERLDDSKCTVNDVAAYWWRIKVPGINANSGQTLTASVQLATSERMQGVVWDFKNCVAVRVEHQPVSWGAASTLGGTSTFDNVADMQTYNADSVKALAAYLKDQGESSNLGLEVYNNNTTTKMNIARAEAKLDVETSLTKQGSSDMGKSVTISDADTAVNYNVKIASTAGGYANDFEYYIPIVSKSSTLDESALVAKNEFGMNLQGPLTVTQDKDDQSHPFTVFYTTQEGLTSSNIRSDSVTWVTSDKVTDYSKVTAVKIITNENVVEGQYIKHGESYQFTLSMKYDNSASDFSQMAGSQIEWGSFGRYTYNRDGAATTNTYPSGKNDVKIRYQRDMTASDQQMTAVLDTSASKNDVDVACSLGHSFKKNQSFKIKKVKASDGTQLITGSPAGLTGSAANTQFRVAFNINNIGADVLSESGVAKSWNVKSGQPVTLQANVSFSKALTDVATPRYIDVTLGNDDVDIVCRIQLVRRVAAADATASGVAPGENFQVPNVSDSCTISRNSAFTGLYVIKNFVPGNFASQKISWCDSTGAAVKLPAGTTLTMMRISDTNTVTDYWYYKADGNSSSVDLKQFKRMSGTEAFAYDTTATSGTTLRYLVVADFGDADALAGAYKMKFSAADSGGTAKDFAELPVTLAKETTYALTLTKTDDLTMKASYDITRQSVNDSYLEGKTLALVMKADSAIPADAYLMDESTKYYRNSHGEFIIPIGTIQKGEKSLTLCSKMFPDGKTDYQLSGRLYVAGSNVSEAPMNGEPVDQERTVTLSKVAMVKPALKITGTRVGLASDWSRGQDFSFTVRNIPTGGTVTVTPYDGLTGNQKVTDLLSSVSGVFTLQNGVGTYDSSKVASGKLNLSSTAAPGTYRLLFEVKNSDGKTVLSAPYYVVVREK